nr:hypothetical protein [Tanacetum cinerariifolium]
ASPSNYRLLPSESQRNTIDFLVVVTDSSATDYDLTDESSICSIPLLPLKKLYGAEPSSGPKTIKSILRSKSTFKAKALKAVTINEPSSAHAKSNKSPSASKVHSAPGVSWGEKKIAWVSWNKCLANKKSGGLGIGSIYALNNGGIFDEHLHRSIQSPWSGILSLVKSIKQKGIDLLFPRIYMLDKDKGCSVANWLPMLDWSSFLRRIPRGGVEDAQFSELRLIIDLVVLTSQKDSWLWSLDVSKGFMVASVRSSNDSHALECGLITTRWNRSIPIKVNIFLWRLWLDKLPSRVNLDRRARVFPEAVGGTLLWSIWCYRNRLGFSNSSPKKSLLWDSIVSQSFLWISSRNPKLKFS